MLGLGQQVRCDELGIGSLVGEHGDLGGAGEQIDPDPAEQLAFGLGHERVARTDDHVDGLPALPSAERHRRQRLHAPEGIIASAPEVAIECNTGA